MLQPRLRLAGQFVEWRAMVTLGEPFAQFTVESHKVKGTGLAGEPPCIANNFGLLPPDQPLISLPLSVQPVEYGTFGSTRCAAPRLLCWRETRRPLGPRDPAPQVR